MVFTFFLAPSALALACLPALLLIGCVLWIDRLEPEPPASRIHALLWGATVAVLISGSFNGLVAYRYGDDVAAVFSAPIVEESVKALGIWWAVRRREVDSAANGVVYALLVAAGFAAVENVMYFSGAAATDSLAKVFVVRGVLTPFAHPLFTVWTGFCLGRAVAQKPAATRRTFFELKQWCGLPVAVALHAAWNALATRAPGALAGIGFAAFFALFVATSAWLMIARRRALAAFVESAPETVRAARLDQRWVAVFSSWSSLLKARKTLPSHKRTEFDRVHAAVSRLVDYRSRPSADVAVEHELTSELYLAVMAFGPWFEQPELRRKPGGQSAEKSQFATEMAPVDMPSSSVPKLPPTPPRV